LESNFQAQVKAALSPQIQFPVAVLKNIYVVVVLALVPSVVRYSYYSVKPDHVVEVLGGRWD
jgi:hypothetical protein